MADWFWILMPIFMAVFVNVLVSLYQRRCRRRGVCFEMFGNLEKHKRLVRVMDFVVVFFIVLGMLFIGPIIFDELWFFDEDPKIQEDNLNYGVAAGLLMLMHISVFGGLLVSMLSPFHTNITIMKRVVLFLISGLPVVSVMLMSILCDFEMPNLVRNFSLCLLVPVFVINLPMVPVALSISNWYRGLISQRSAVDIVE